MKIIHDRQKCIGCGSCVALCPKYWEMETDGKATLRGSKKADGGVYELMIQKPDCNQEAADVCPVQIISIKE